jgi:curved DNA-binding protein CbpA
VDHYGALGVARDASAADIRRAYLRLARRFHPDRQASIDVLDRDLAERRMREVNEAWTVLSDPSRRSAYDRTLAAGAASTGAPTGSHAADPDVLNRPSSTFRPYFDVDEDDDDSWRYEPDAPAGGAAGRALTVVPAALLAVGFGALVVGLVAGVRPLAALAVVCFLLAGLLFLTAPLLAMFTSRTAEAARADARARRRSRPRSRRGPGRPGRPRSRR